MSATVTDLLSRLAEVDPAALADADKGLRVMDAGMRPVAGGRRLLGIARTVRCHEDFLAVIQALEDAAAGEVLVVDTGGSTRAVVGELFSMEAARRNLGGIVVDGMVRDVATIRELALPVYARGYCPASGTTDKLREIQLPVACGGVRVSPGDILVGDDDGIVVGSVEEFSAIIDRAAGIVTAEARLRQRMDAGESLFDMLNFDEHAARLERGEPSRLAFRLDE